ncbi:MAG: acetyl-CoA carboxylase biotin carboxyl carrier protein [Phycisphaerales bacterium]|jgi:acetyl-CoA carboxylase biotin carboxyl carrier protein
MIDIKKLEELVALMKANDLSEVDLKKGEDVISIKRAIGGVPMMAAPVHVAPAQMAPVAAPAAAPAAAAAPATPQAAIESPMVGTCYLAPNPDAAPFIKIGQSVTPDTVVCLIEAMKVFNEIKAEKSGVIEQVLVKNGQAVEFGQKMFSIRPN